MTTRQLPHGAWVLVGDGRRALVLRNEGDQTFPNLRALEVFREKQNPLMAHSGSDKPGRAIEHLTNRRSAHDQVDWHELAEAAFAQKVAAALTEHHDEGAISALVVVAPPRTLAELRRSFPTSLQGKIIAEIDKDLTKHPIHEIERLVVGSMS